ncbi:MAG: GtrA family protein [Clostridia bacterium]|nr:GtrA family protein [Clostridia bacterium]
MKQLFAKIKNTFLSAGFIEFCLLGAINTFDDALFSWLFHFILQENAAAVAGYAVALTIAFFLSSKVIFKSKPTFKKYVRFVVSYIPNFIIYFLVTFITINTMHLPQFWATVLAAMAGGPITYVIIKIYAFGKR